VAKKPSYDELRQQVEDLKAIIASQNDTNSPAPETSTITQSGSDSALRENRERHELAMRFTSDGLYDWNLESNEIYFSPAWKKILGYEDHEIKNEFAEWERLTMPADIETSWVMLNELLEGKRERFELEFQMRHKDGRRVDVLSRANVVRNETGKAIRVVGTHVDITARKQAELALKKSETFLLEAQQVANLGCWEWNTVTDEAVWSREMYNILGYDPLSDKPGFGVWLDTLHPADKEGIIELQNSIAKGKNNFELECRMIMKNKSIRYLYIKGQRQSGKDSDVIIVGVLQDITERKLSQKALQISEERYRTLTTMSPGGVYQTDRNGDCDYVNLAWQKMSGLSQAEASGKGWLNGIHPEDRDSIHDGWEKMVSSGGKWGHEYRFMTPDGVITWVYGLATAISDSSGSTLGYLGLNVDITQRKLAEKAIEREQAQLKAIIDNIPVMITRFNPDVNMMFLNRAFETKFGWTTEEVQKINMMEQMIPDPEEYKAAIEYMQAAKVEWREFKLTAKNGEDSYSEWSNIELDDGTLIGIGLDQTQRIHAENVLSEVEARYKALFDNIESAVAVYKVENNGEDYIFVDFNTWAEKIEKISRDQLIGKNVIEVFPGITKLGLLDKFKQVWETGQPAFVPIEFYQDDRLTGWRENYVYKLQTGEIVAVYRDVTEQKLAEIALAESEEKYRALFESMAQGVFWQRADGVLLDCNEALLEMFGVTRDQFLGRTVSDENWNVFAENGVKLAADEYPASVAMRTGKAVRGMTAGMYNPKKNDTVWLNVNAIPQFKSGEESPHQVFVTAHDITDQLQAEKSQQQLQAQLLQAQKMESIGRLAGGVAHDFNNMLNVILGHVDLALDVTPEDHPSGTDLAEIRKAAKHSASLTRQLLAFARRQTIVPKVLNLNETVQPMLKMLKRLIGEDIELQWEPGSIESNIRIDPAQVDQLLANLVVNARDAIGSIGTVTIQTYQVVLDDAYCAKHVEYEPGEYIMLSVSDDGEGMDEATRAQIFEPFFTTKGISEGTGLGLATAYGIVKQNHGFIRCNSAPGQGTTFSIHLPVTLESPEEHPRSESKNASSAPGSETILLVEDEEAILSLGKIILEKTGYHVLAAATPGEAIKMAQDYSGEVHLLLTDVIMPEMNGRALATRILSIYPFARCLFMSGYTADVIAHHGVLDEGVHFLQKPFSKNQLANSVRDVLDED
jgi:PAS domain S-box-containing protein